MMKPIKEWDLDSLSRKFANAHCIFEMEDGSKATKHLSEIRYINEDNIEFRDIHDNKIPGYPIYARVPAGWYRGSKGKDWLLLIRKKEKVFTQGVNQHSYRFYQFRKGELVQVDYNWRWDIDLTTLPEYNPQQAFEKGGPISPHIYISGAEIAFLDEVIGLRKGKNLLVEEWCRQEVADALTGVQCNLA